MKGAWLKYRSPLSRDNVSCKLDPQLVLNKLVERDGLNGPCVLWTLYCGVKIHG